jgi:hypothetical protein
VTSRCTYRIRRDTVTGTSHEHEYNTTTQRYRALSKHPSAPTRLKYTSTVLHSSYPGNYKASHIQSPPHIVPMHSTDTFRLPHGLTTQVTTVPTITLCFVSHTTTTGLPSCTMDRSSRRCSRTLYTLRTAGPAAYPVTKRVRGEVPQPWLSTRS